MLLYDVIALQAQGKVLNHGGGTYAKIILRRLLERNISFCAFYDSRLKIDSTIMDELHCRNVTLFDIAETSFEEIIERINSPLVFSILPKPYMFITKVVGTIHDCRELELPNDWWELYYPFSLKRLLVKLFCWLFPRKYMTIRHTQLKDKICHENFYPVTITEYTKNRLIHYYQDDRFKNIKVFSTPISEKVTNATIEPKEKFFLLVSGERWLKNNLRAIVALDGLFTEGKFSGFQVKITGTRSLSIYKKRIRNTSRFETIGYVGDNELQDLYKKAFCFIFPSLNEGFGIPPLEAMKYGTPVVVSNKSAIPEVCGDAVLYFDPFSIKDIQKSIEKTLQSQIYKHLQEMAITHYNMVVQKTMADVDAYLDFVLQYDS